jgi:hypothetical protein
LVDFFGTIFWITSTVALREILRVIGGNVEVGTSFLKRVSGTTVTVRIRKCFHRGKQIILNLLNETAA